MFRLRVLLLLAAALAAGCRTAPARPVPSAATVASLPELRLSPAALPDGLALQQRLTFTRGERHETVDALVEADARSVRVLIHAQGQVALRLAWDGTTLQETRADWLPPSLQAGRVLADLQLVYWPRDAVAAALPSGWRIEDAGGVRTLYAGAETVVAVQWPQPDVAILHNVRDGYELRIESLPVTP